MLELEPPPPVFCPDEGWIDAFKQQCTDELRLSAKRFALRRLSGVRSTGRAVSEEDAKDLVQDAIVDTLYGKLAWEPSAKTLKQHIEDAVTWRARRVYNRAKRFRHERMDAIDASAPVRTEIEASMQMDREDDSAEELVFGDEVLGQLREAAQGDTLVLRFLDAIVDGAKSRADIMEFAKMSLKTYRNARARLRRIVDRLDQARKASHEARRS